MVGLIVNRAFRFQQASRNGLTALVKKFTLCTSDDTTPCATHIPINGDRATSAALHWSGRYLMIFTAISPMMSVEGVA